MSCVTVMTATSGLSGIIVAGHGRLVREPYRRVRVARRKAQVDIPTRLDFLPSHLPTMVYESLNLTTAAKPDEGDLKNGHCQNRGHNDAHDSTS